MESPELYDLILQSGGTGFINNYPDRLNQYLIQKNIN